MKLKTVFSFFIILLQVCLTFGQILVLGYHKVVVPSGHNKVDHYKNYLEVSHREFENQLKFLRNEGFDNMTPEQLNQAFNSRKAPPGKHVLFTFDDGYKSIITQAYPLMKKYGFTGTVFLNSSTVGKLIWTNDHISLEDLRFLLSEGWSLGNHTCSHIKLDQSSNLEIREQISSCQNYIDGIFPQGILLFAYPSGFHSKKIISTLKQLRFNLAFTTHNGPVRIKDSRFMVNRYFPLYLEKLARFKERVRSFM